MALTHCHVIVIGAGIGMVRGRCFAQAPSPEDALLRYERARKHRANASAGAGSMPTTRLRFVGATTQRPEAPLHS